MFRQHRRSIHKIFHVPGQATNKATKRMLTKHNLRPAAREMNIVPGLHSTLISVPKLADAGYTTVFSKAGAMIYDDYTTKISASNPPVLDANRCESTGLWKLPLDDKTKETSITCRRTKPSTQSSTYQALAKLYSGTTPPPASQ